MSFRSDIVDNLVELVDIAEKMVDILAKYANSPNAGHNLVRNAKTSISEVRRHEEGEEHTFSLASANAYNACLLALMWADGVHKESRIKVLEEKVSTLAELVHVEGRLGKVREEISDKKDDILDQAVVDLQDKFRQIQTRINVGIPPAGLGPMN